jgi:1,4-dihydroxy-2-naphthoate octaprenyltransferase
VLLVINNYRDRYEDKLSGKRTIVVRFGERFGRYLYLWLGIVAVLLSVYLLYNDIISLPGFILSSLIYLYLHMRTWQKMVLIRRGKALNIILGENSRNMLLYGILLSAAIVVGGYL